MLLIEDNLIFYTDEYLKIYKLKQLGQEPEKTKLILNMNDRVKLSQYDNNNIIIKTINEIIKYNFKTKQINLRIRNEYEELSITKNYILGFKKTEMNILNKNFELIQKKIKYRFDEGLEFDNKIVIIKYSHFGIEIVSYEKSIIKAIIFANLRYIFLGILSILCFKTIKYIIHYLINFDFLKFDLYYKIVLFFLSFVLLKELFFHYFNFQRDLIPLPSDYF